MIPKHNSKILKQKTMNVVEIFGPTIQGEGMYIGRPTVFVRFGGCDYRCSWCDSVHAINQQYNYKWIKKTSEEILNDVEKLTNANPILITITGGNPAIQDLYDFLVLAKSKGHILSMETQGSIFKSWFNVLDQLTLSPKPPSSGEDTNWSKLDSCLKINKKVNIALKVVIFDRIDYIYAKEVSKRYFNIPFFLSIGNDNIDHDSKINKELLYNKTRKVINWVNDDHWYQVTILPQLHVILWGNKLKK